MIPPHYYHPILTLYQGLPWNFLNSVLRVESSFSEFDFNYGQKQNENNSKIIIQIARIKKLESFFKISLLCTISFSIAR